MGSVLEDFSPLQPRSRMGEGPVAMAATTCGAELSVSWQWLPWKLTGFTPSLGVYNAHMKSLGCAP